MAIDINCDMGESFGVYKLGADEEMLDLITSANIACGFHAGDPMIMDRTTRTAVAKGVRVGAHPGYPDLLGFGRRAFGASPDEVERYVLYQIGALHAIAKANGTELQHVSPHGSLGNLCAADITIARAVANAVARFSKSLILCAIAGSCTSQAGRELDLRVAELALLDRNYNDDGTLVPRSKPNAIIHDPEVVASRAVDVARDGHVKSLGGKPIKMTAHTITLHGDNAEAVQNAVLVVSALKNAGVRLAPMSEIV